MREIVAETRPERVIVLQVDAALQDAAEYAADDLLGGIALKGWDGTDFTRASSRSTSTGYGQACASTSRAWSVLATRDRALLRHDLGQLGAPPSDRNREPWSERLDIAAS